MLKFFRKYNTIILVVGGVFLMIAFLLPQAIQQFSPNFGSQKQFQFGDVTYGSEEVFDASRENVVLANTFDPIIGFRNSHQILLGMEGTDHYLMLAQLADEAGLYNPGGTPEEMLGRLYRQLVGQFPTEEQAAQLQQLYDNAVVEVRDPELAANALRRLDAIFRLRLLYRTSTALSEPELALYSTRLFNAVTASIGFVPGEGYAIENLGPFTEDDFVAQYERFKNDFRQDNEYGFSYRLDDAAKFELLLIDRQLISDAITLDNIELRKHHRVNFEERGWSEDYSISRVTVERDLRDAKVDEILEQITGAVDNALVNATSQLARADDGSRVLPDDWAERRPTFESLAELANSAADDLIVTAEPVARVLRYTDTWYTRDDIRQATELLTLGLTAQGTRATLSNAIMLFPEFEPQTAVPDAQVGLTLAGITDAPTGRPSGAGYLRVLDVRREGPSASIEEVRDAVERDTRALRGYESLVSQLDTFRNEALADGRLDSYVFDISDEYAERALDSEVRYYDVQFRGPSGVFVRGLTPNSEISQAINNEQFARRVIEPTTAFDPTVQTNAISEEDRFFALELPAAQGIALVTVTRHAPLPLEQLQFVSSEASTYLAERVRDANPEMVLRSSLSKASLAERFTFVAFNEDYELEADVNAGDAGEDESE